MAKSVSCAVLAVLCIGIILAALPLMNRNVEDPNLIAYFNHDEGFQMDLAWLYYTGEKQDSFQYESDYGVELLYLTDFAKPVLSRFIKFTPGIFVLLLRWTHLAFWVASILALWSLVRRHFGSYWQPILIAALLAVRPAFPLLLQNSKPEPVVLFFMIIGLDYILRIIDNPSRINLALAVACAAIAAVVKFAGIFLLPAIAAAMYFAVRLKGRDVKIFPEFKKTWALPAVLGAGIAILSSAVILFYVRQSTGLTWHEQFGFRNSILQSPLILCSYAAAMLLFVFSLILKALSVRGDGRLKSVTGGINTFFSHCTVVFLMFALLSLLFGFGWVLRPRYFIQSYATIWPEAFSVLTVSPGFLSAVCKGFVDKVKAFDVVIAALLLFYVFIEIKFKSENMKLKTQPSFFKRITLFIFVLGAIPCMIFPIRFTHHHMLPFIVVSLILITEGAKMAFYTASRKAWQRKTVMCLIGFFLAVDIAQNAAISAGFFRYMYRWRDDVVFDIVKWWRKNYGPDTAIIADHPVMAYLPPEYKNAKFLKYQKDRVTQLREFVRVFKPRLIYYNTGISKNTVMPPIAKILPGRNVRLAAVFDNSGKYYKRHPQSKYVIYEIIY